ncbi:MAG: hypothetical protein JWM31_2462 [Solirubrobacterales bacterium]|nr:hypothetical protein [Solirubrobacterales bacterium]
MSTPPDTPAQPLGRAFWAGLAVGGGIMVFGVAGFVRHRVETDPTSSLKFLVGALVVHDALWAWVVAALGFVLVRTVPRAVRGVTMGALGVSAALALVAGPALTGRGRIANNPSILPRDYGTGLLLALAAVWAVAALLAVRALRHPALAADVPPAYANLPPQNGW